MPPPHREEWEEDLTSTQQLALSVGSGDRKSKNQYVEPTVKLNNFVAPGPPIKKAGTQVNSPLA